MDKAQLLLLQREAEAKFNQLTKDKADYIRSTDEELNRLQGEYRLVTRLIDELGEDNDKE